jgi:hypothetical protein
VQRAYFETGEQADLAQQILFGIEQRPAALDDQFAESRQREGTRLAVQQHDVQFRLQRLDAVGGRRLRDIQRSCCAPEMPLLNEQQQVAKAALADQHKEKVIKAQEKGIG